MRKRTRFQLPRQCGGCPLADRATGFCADMIDSDSEVTLLIDAPTSKDANVGKPLNGRTGTMYKEELFPLAGMHHYDKALVEYHDDVPYWDVQGTFSVAHVRRCRVEGDISPADKRKAHEHCRQYDHIPEHTKLVVASGDDAWQLAGGEGKVTEWRGFIVETDQGLDPDRPWDQRRFDNHGLPVLATLPPSKLIADFDDLTQGAPDSRMILPTKRDYSKVAEFLAGTWPQPWPSITMYEDATLELPALMGEPHVVVDTEYDIKQGNKLYQVGLYAPTRPDLGVVIWDRYRKGAAHVAEVKLFVQEMVKFTKPIFQHAPADIPVLELDPELDHEDTVLMDAALYSEWPHNLGFMESMHGRHYRVKHLGPGSYEYLRGDVCTTAYTFLALNAELDADPESRVIYETSIKPLTPVLVDFAKRGLRVHKPYVENAVATLSAQTEIARRVGEAWAGYPINLNATAQIARMLYDDGTLPNHHVKRTATGQASLSKDTIAMLRDTFQERDADEPFTLEYHLARMEAGAHPLLEARAAFIEARQLLSLCVKPMTGVDRIYPAYLPFAQANGRWSSLKPNIAQIPGKMMKMLCPDVGFAWLKFDWSAIEGRIMALAAGDEMMINAFEKGWDLHVLNMCETFGYPYPTNRANPHTSEEDAQWRSLLGWDGKEDPRRTFQKTLMYRLFYGGKPEAADTIPGVDALKIKIQEVTGEPFEKSSLVAASKRWIKAHPGLQRVWTQLERDARSAMVVRNIFGRRRVLFSRDLKRRIREAYDFPMQSAVSEIMNRTVRAFWDLTKDDGGHLAFTRHDCIAWAVPEDLVDHYLPLMKELAEVVVTIGTHSLKMEADFEPVQYSPEYKEAA